MKYELPEDVKKALLRVAKELAIALCDSVSTHVDDAKWGKYQDQVQLVVRMVMTQAKFWLEQQQI